MKTCLAILVISLAIPTDARAHQRHGGLVAAAPARPAATSSGAGRSWLAGDHHIHSEHSADYEPNPANPTAPPKPLLGKDGLYSITRNAEMARRFGLRWVVATDHGGPLHSKLNFDLTYPALLRSRRAVPELLQFYGMEFDTPAGDHSSLIIPRTPNERTQLLELESRFSKREAWPLDPARDTEPRMIEALRQMRAQASPPVLIANHPSRSAKKVGRYGLYTPSEFRNWNDTAPAIAIGMEGAPGHQAGALRPDGTYDPDGARGGYRNAPTMGGFDQMTAILGGFWDSMLGEGRRWWITATSDSHANWRDGGNDFWPGEYSKTYVLARAQEADILDGVRQGRMFVTTGDLITDLDVIVKGPGRTTNAAIGGAIVIAPGSSVDVTIRVRDPGHGQTSDPETGKRNPTLRRVDLIVGKVLGPVSDRATDNNPTTRVERRFGATDWKREGEFLTMTHRLRKLNGPIYLRVRGTNTAELEPLTDPKGEDPWSDLWFYANPIFVSLAS